MPGGICSTVPSLYTINELKWKSFLLRIYKYTSCVIILILLFHFFFQFKKTQAKVRKSTAATKILSFLSLSYRLKVTFDRRHKSLRLRCCTGECLASKADQGRSGCSEVSQENILKTWKEKDNVKMKVAHIDIVVLRLIPAHEGVVPCHRQPGNQCLSNADQFNGIPDTSTDKDAQTRYLSSISGSSHRDPQSVGGWKIRFH